MRLAFALLVVTFGCAEGTPVTAVDAGVEPDALDPPKLPGDDASADTNVGCPFQCSNDFHSVLDCYGKPIETCSGTSGCNAIKGTCTDACQAAIDNHLSVGCEYYATHMATLVGANHCFAAFVANTWTTNATIAVEFGGQTLPISDFARIPSGTGASVSYAPYDQTKGLAPGEVAILFLGGATGAAPKCPIPSAVGSQAMLATTGKGKSFRITSDVPVVAYEMNPYGGGSAAVTGASLLLPVSAWDTNYIANTASPYTTGGPSINVIASRDGTIVTLLPSVTLQGGGSLPGGPKNAPVTFTLNKGQQAQFIQNEDLVGSVIQSTEPIGVMAGNPCMNVPVGVGFCDHGEQMIPPVRALGHEYVAVMHRPRSNEPAIWRFVGAVDGTKLSYSSAISGAPLSIEQGEMKEVVSATPFVVKSQDDAHPFELFEYMSGSAWNKLSVNNGYGDADFALIYPPQQYMPAYVFFTDPTFPETNLVVVRKRAADGLLKDVVLDCAGTLTGWQPVGDYEYTRRDLSTGDFVPAAGCDNGRHEIHSDGPLGLWVWGWGTPDTSTFTKNVSYAYPGGMNVQPINAVVVPPTPK